MKTYTEEDVLTELRRRIKAAGSQLQAAEDLGVSSTFIGDVLARRRNISKGFAKSLGFNERERRFERVKP